MNNPPSENSPTLHFPVTQGDHFYTRLWTPYLDKIFILSLLQARRLEMFETGRRQHYPAVVYVTNNLNMDIGQYFNYDDCNAKLLLIHKRFRVFRSILQKSGVHYDETTNCMVYSRGVFAEILEQEPFARAYQISGDPMWSELQEIFGGLDDGAQVPAPEIVGEPSRSQRISMPRATVPFVDLATQENTVHLPPNEYAQNDRDSDESVNQRALSLETVSTSRISGTRPPKPSPCKGSNNYYWSFGLSH